MGNRIVIASTSVAVTVVCLFSSYCPFKLHHLDTYTSTSSMLPCTYPLYSAFLAPLTPPAFSASLMDAASVAGPAAPPMPKGPAGALKGRLRSVVAG